MANNIRYGGFVGVKPLVQANPQLTSLPEQLANTIANRISPKQPNSLLDYLGNAVGQAVQYGGQIATTSLQRKLLVQKKSPQLYNIVRTNQNNQKKLNTKTIILILIAIGLIFIIWRK